MGIFFQVFPREPVIFKFWTNFKGSDLNKKLMVVAGTQGDNPSIFSSYPATRIFRLSPWVTATTLNFLVWFFSGKKKKIESRRHESWQRPSTFLLPFAGNKKKIESRRHESRRRPSTFLLPFSGNKKKNWELSPWVTATTLNFVVLITSLNYDS